MVKCDQCDFMAMHSKYLEDHRLIHLGTGNSDSMEESCTRNGISKRLLADWVTLKEKSILCEDDGNVHKVQKIKNVQA